MDAEAKWASVTSADTQIEVASRDTALPVIHEREVNQAQTWIRPIYEQWMILPPGSPIFLEDGYKLSRLEVLHPENLWRNSVRMTVTGNYNKYGKEIIEFCRLKLKALEPWYRGGGAHNGVPIKRLGRHHKWMPWLIGAAVEPFRRPIGEVIRAKWDIMFDWFYNKTEENHDKAIADPSLILVGKEGGTGTGYESPLNNRELFSKNLDYYSPQVRAAYKTEYTFMKFFMQPEHPWPYYCGMAPVNPMFKFIRKGGRDDPQALSVKQNGTLAIHTVDVTARQVMATPSGALHGPGLTTSKDLLSLRDQLKPPILALPNDKKAFSEVMASPPVTAPFIKDGTVTRGLLSVDIGFSNHEINSLGGVLHEYGETVKFGADNIQFSGLALYGQSDQDRILHQLASGAPYTEISYTPDVWIVQDVVDRHSLNVQVYNIGDDWHITGSPEHLFVIAEELAPMMRTKGMWENLVFILGRYNWWESPDVVDSFVMPRIMKSVPSATAGNYQTPKVQSGAFDVEVKLTDAQKMGGQDFLSRYGEYLLVEMTKAEMEQYIQSGPYADMQLEMAAIGGISEFAAEIQFGKSILEPVYDEG